MNKLDRVKRRLIRDGLIVTVCCAVASGVLWFSNQQYAGAEQQGSTLKGQISSANQQVQQFEGEYQKATKFSAQFKQYAGKGYRREDLDRKEAVTVVERLKDRFYLSEIDMESLPYVSLNTPPWVGKTIRLGAVPINIRLKAFSDEYLYAFLFALDHELTGFMRYNKLTVNRVHTLADVPLKEVGEGFLPSLVEADIQFLWLAFEAIPKEGAGAPTP